MELRPYARNDGNQLDVGSVSLGLAEPAVGLAAGAEPPGRVQVPAAGGTAVNRPREAQREPRRPPSLHYGTVCCKPFPHSFVALCVDTGKYKGNC